MRIHRSTLLLATLLLAACGSEPADDAATPAQDSVDAPAVAERAGDSAAAAPVAAAPTIVLAQDGLRITGGTQTAAQVGFGTAREQVLGQVGGVIAGEGTQAEQAECPAGPLTTTKYPAGLELVFQEGKFVGWAAESGTALRTEAGIGPGSTLGQLRAAYPAATVDETSLGIEFMAGELYGVVSDSTAAGQVEIMFAGINCIFR